MANLEEKIENSVKDSRFRKIISKTKDIITRFYPELIVPGYVALSSLLIYRNDLFREPEDVSIERSIYRGLETSLILYLSLVLKRSKDNEKKRSKVTTNNQKGYTRILNYPITAGLILSGIRNLPEIMKKLELLCIGTKIQWDDYMTQYNNLIEKLPEHNISTDYSPRELLTEQLLRQIPAMLCILPQTIATTYILFEIGKNFKDQKQKRYVKRVLQYVGNKLIGKDKRVLELSDEMEEEFNNNIEPNIYRSSIYFKQKKYREGFFELKKAREKLSHQNKTPYTFIVPTIVKRLNVLINQTIGRHNLRRKIKRRRKKENEIKLNEDDIVFEYCRLAYMCNLSGMQKTGLKILDEAYQHFPNNIELRTLYAQELENSKNKEDNEKAIDMHIINYQTLKKQSKFKLVSCGETTKQVSIISMVSNPTLSSTYVYKKDSLKETDKARLNLEQAKIEKRKTLEEIAIELEKEKSKGNDEAIRRIMKIKEGLETLAFPETIAEIKEDKNIINVMKRGIGYTLREHFNSDSTIITTVFNVLTAMAFIHAKIPIEGREERDQKEYFYERVGLLKDRINVPNNLVNILREGFIVDQRLEHDYVFNKDSHPENWIIQTGLIPGLENKRLLAIDWDEKGIVHQTVEIVNFLDTFTNWNYLLKRKFTDHYLRSYNYFRGIEEPEKQERGLFMVSCLDAMYSRSIELCYAWSSKSRPSMHNCRKRLLTNTISSIVVIRKKFPNFYSEHMTRYCIRNKAIKELIKIM